VTFSCSAAADMRAEIDPTMNHAAPPKKLRYHAKRPDTPTVTPSTSRAKSKSILQSASVSRSRKRPADSSTTPNTRAKKRSKTNSVSHQTLGGGSSVRVGRKNKDSPSPRPEIKNQVEPALQVCRYLLEMFSVPLLRSHATVCSSITPTVR